MLSPTSPSERFTVTLPASVARELRALALRYDNTPARIAATYIRDGIRHAWVREARLWSLPPEEAKAGALADLKLAEKIDAAGALSDRLRPEESSNEGEGEA